MGPIVTVLEHQGGELTQASRELLAKARELSDALAAPVTAVAFGPEAAACLAHCGAADGVAVTGGFDTYVPTVWEASLRAVVDELKPGLVLCANTTLGMDLGASLAAQADLAMIAYVCGLDVNEGKLQAVCQVYAGKLMAEVDVPTTGAVLTVLPGSWPAGSESQAETPVRPLSAAAAPGLEPTRLITPEAGDVDITRADILVSVGRGIEDPDNLELAEALAAALGGVVSCSRPVVDAGWLPRTRQVGKSGQTVKPKLYLALGISGAPEHLQGMKDSELIVAINSDPGAPIFDVAHYGATVDILELMPALTEQLEGGG